MKAFLAILAREIAERKLLLAGAAFASLFPIVLPWLPGLSGQNPAELRGGMALGLALITSSLLALILGTTVIARDLGERRIGFYFARPVPGWAIWAGKMLSAAFLALGVGALILLASWMAGAKIDPTGYWGPMNALVGMSSLVIFSFAVLGVLLLVTLGHAVSIMVRSRSHWLAVDLAALAVVATIFWTRNRLLQQEGAFGVLAWGELGFAAISLFALSLAGLVQVVGGRTDLHRGHRLLSLTLWTLVGAATLGHAAYAHWVLRVTPGDLVSVHGVLPAPAGSWIAVSGRVRDRGGYAPTFLLDTASERSIKLPGGLLTFWWIPPIFSLDGSHAFWFEPAGENAEQLLTIDLRSPRPALRQTGVIYSGDFGIEPSPDGRRIAALAKGRLTVDDLDTGRLLASVPMEGGPPGVFFLRPDRVRILRTSHDEEPGMPEVWRLTTLDLDVAKNRLLPVSRIELPGDRWTWELSPDGRRVILRPSDSREDLIADLETGRTIAIPSERSVLQFLADGRIVRVRWNRDQHVLSLLAPDGAERLHTPLPGARFQLGSNVSPDLLVLATAERGSTQKIEAWTSWLLDLKAGHLQKIGSGMVPAFQDARIGSPSTSTHLFFREPGGLTLFNARTGHLRTILPGAPIESEAGLWLAGPRMTRLRPR
jgi:hypothetical protein